MQTGTTKGLLQLLIILKKIYENLINRKQNANIIVENLSTYEHFRPNQPHRIGQFLGIYGYSCSNKIASRKHKWP